MRLSDCEMGKVVFAPDEIDVGHIVGLTTNSSDEPIPVIAWARRAVTIPVHPANIELYIAQELY